MVLACAKFQGPSWDQCGFAPALLLVQFQVDSLWLLEFTSRVRLQMFLYPEEVSSSQKSPASTAASPCGDLDWIRLSVLPTLLGNSPGFQSGICLPPPPEDATRD